MAEDEAVHPCCGGYREHRHACAARVWPPTATPEIRRIAVRGDSIGPANAQITDLFGKDLDYVGRQQLVRILSGIWDNGHEWGSAHGTEKAVRDA